MKKKVLLQTSFYICLLLLVTSFSATAQQISTSVDRNNILIGEPIDFRIRFTLPSSAYKVEFNAPDSFPHFEMMDKKKFDSTAQKEFFIVQQFKLTSWDSGSWVLPSIPVKLVSIGDNKSVSLLTDSIAIEVGYAPADSTGELRDIKPVMDVFYVDRSWIYIAAAILAGLILLWLLIRYLRRRPRKVKDPYAGKRSAYEEAMKALDNLQPGDIKSQDDAKVFYTSLGEIFKRYYVRKKSINLQTKTTAEVLLALRKANVGANTLGFVETALTTGDAAKFAKYLPPAQDSDQCKNIVRQAITQINDVPGN